MRLSRIFHADALAVGAIIHLDERASNYIVRVLRLKPGAQMILFNGQGGEFFARVKTSDQKRVQVEIEKYSDKNPESPLYIHLGQGIARGDKMDTIIQKAVELGVHEITPLITERSEVKLQGPRLTKRMEHWRGIIISSCEQSTRTRLPILNEPQTLVHWLASKKSGLGLLFHPNAENSFAELTEAENPIQVLVGPEGGLSDDEVNLAKHHDFKTVCLGPRVFRTETAALVAVSVLQYKWGDFRDL